MRSGHPLNTLEKHAPIWTLGVGGRPLLGGRGGVCLRRCLRGGTGGQETKSGVEVSFVGVVSVPAESTRNIIKSSL